MAQCNNEWNSSQIVASKNLFDEWFDSKSSVVPLSLQPPCTNHSPWWLIGVVLFLQHVHVLLTRNHLKLAVLTSSESLPESINADEKGMFI